MFPGRLHDLTFQKIKELSLSESETLDYKEKVENSDRGRQDFACDVCAFANTDGGDLVIGVTERNLVPSAFPGIDSPAEEQTRLTDIIASRIEPRIHGIDYKILEIDEKGKGLLIVRIPKSYNGPHVDHEKRTFYRRHNEKNDRMSWKEISESFLSRKSVFDRIRDFLNGRIQGFFVPPTNGTTNYWYLGPPVALVQGITSILHLLPLQSFEKNESLNVQELRKRYGNVSPFPLLLTREGMSCDVFSRLNIDGILLYQAPGVNHSYTQMFRNGAIEAVRVYRKFEGKTPIFPILRFEDEVRRWVRISLEQFREIGIQPPFHLSVFIKDGVGSVIDTRRPGEDFPIFTSAYSPLDRNPLFLPEILIENVEDTEPQLMELFTALWNAYGLPRPNISPK
ncbi:AlbA family DNA-binding domain-containing protein [Leptospirillum ferriphilum]|uniref:Schlafen AlbA-2 domain-containing protein n=1 Tax=Leptospirillum ferriphilum TaxID=178606 RepID=A0A1V3SVV3_9BACT|nr:ATP-binding protein [Leptospirillum ferriphilum]OOH71645.1 hypothetical protein BOX24_09080 [Leptospirillum ferriphilum]